MSINIPVLESMAPMAATQVSGVEQTTAASFEARHSYTLDDLFWDRTPSFMGHDFSDAFFKTILVRFILLTFGINGINVFFLISA